MSHAWLRRETDDMAVAGITDYAQDMLGDVVFVDLPAVGRVVAAGEEICTLESVKTVVAVHAPLAGVVVATNDALKNAPETINHAPYESWLFRLRVAGDAAFSGLQKAADYASAFGGVLEA
jgi:glycine cleavage system H protein